MYTILKYYFPNYYPPKKKFTFTVKIIPVSLTPDKRENEIYV